MAITKEIKKKKNNNKKYRVIDHVFKNEDTTKTKVKTFF